MFSQIARGFRKCDSAHMAEYGHTSSGKIHIWSNYRERSLCGKYLTDKFKYNHEVRHSTVCKSCGKSNKIRRIKWSF